MDSDRVLILSAGEVGISVLRLASFCRPIPVIQVTEFDSPKTLLGNKQSAFYSLAAEAGLA